MTNEQKSEYAVQRGAQQVGPGTGALIRPPYQQKPSAVATYPFEYNAPPASTPAQGFSGANGMLGQFPGVAPVQMPGQPQGQLPELITTQSMASIRPHTNVAPTSSTYFNSSTATPLSRQAGRGPETASVSSAERKYLAKLKKHPMLFALSALCLIAVVAALGLSAWHFLKGAPSVTLYRTSTQTVSEGIGGGGIVYPVQRLDISYPFASHVLAVFVKPGDKVTPNQSLVQLDLSQTNARSLAQLQAQAAAAKQEVQAALQYLDSVIPTGKSVVIAQAQQQYSAAQARYNALLAESSSPTLHQGNLISPLTGTVTAVNVYPGQTFGANKVMLTVFDESSVIVRVEVPLSNYGQVQLNQSAVITPSALMNANFNGSVISIIQNVNPQTNTFEVWVKVNNTTGNLLPGMSAFVQIQYRVRMLVVPRLAVLNPDRDSIVFVERKQHVYIQHVQVVGYTGDSLLIGSGLAPNDLIVLVGLDSLQDRQEVQVTGVENQAN